MTLLQNHLALSNLNRKYSKHIESSEDVSRNIVWKLKKMKWNNLFNYGVKNEIDFEIIGGKEIKTISCFSTRPDTLFGLSFFRMGIYFQFLI